MQLANHTVLFYSKYCSVCKWFSEQIRNAPVNVVELLSMEFVCIDNDKIKSILLSSANTELIVQSVPTLVHIDSRGQTTIYEWPFLYQLITNVITTNYQPTTTNISDQNFDQRNREYSDIDPHVSPKGRVQNMTYPEDADIMWPHMMAANNQSVQPSDIVNKNVRISSDIRDKKHKRKQSSSRRHKLKKQLIDDNEIAELLANGALADLDEPLPSILDTNNTSQQQNNSISANYQSEPTYASSSGAPYAKQSTAQEKKNKNIMDKVADMQRMRERDEQELDTLGKSNMMAFSSR